MKTFLARITKAAGVAYADAGAKLVVYLQTEPVRARSAVLSVVVAVGTVIPGLSNGSVNEVIAGALTSVVTILVGETARAKVSPTGK